MNSKKVPSVYSMLDFKNPEELHRKAVVASEISMLVQSNEWKVSEAAALLKISENEMLSILKGQFEEYQISDLEAYVSNLRYNAIKES